MSEAWTAERWIEWLRDRSQPPSVKALKDCADALEQHLQTRKLDERDC